MVSVPNNGPSHSGLGGQLGQAMSLLQEDLIALTSFPGEVQVPDPPTKYPEYQLPQYK